MKLYVFLSGKPKQVFELAEGVSIEQVFKETFKWQGTKLISISPPDNDSFDWTI